LKLVIQVEKGCKLLKKSVENWLKGKKRLLKYSLNSYTEDDISRIMRRINTAYAYYFNKKYNRVGHVFQDRFKSETIEDEPYLLSAIRYIHNNPEKSKDH